MKIIRILISLVVLGIMILILISYFNYSDTSWEANSSEYIALGAGFFILLSNGVSIVAESGNGSK